MNEEQVEHIQAQIAHGGLEAAQGVVAPMVAVVELGGHPQLVAGHSRARDGGADAGLVAVHLGGVDMPVADVEGVADHAFDLLDADLVGAQTQLRHLQGSGLVGPPNQGGRGRGNDGVHAL